MKEKWISPDKSFLSKFCRNLRRTQATSAPHSHTQKTARFLVEWGVYFDRRGAQLLPTISERGGGEGNEWREGQGCNTERGWRTPDCFGAERRGSPAPTPVRHEATRHPRAKGVGSVRQRQEHRLAVSENSAARSRADVK